MSGVCWAQDGNLGVFYKSAGEIYLMAGRAQEAAVFFSRAVTLFQLVTDIDVSRLIAECQSMIQFASAQRQN